MNLLQVHVGQIGNLNWSTIQKIYMVKIPELNFCSPPIVSGIRLCLFYNFPILESVSVFSIKQLHAPYPNQKKPELASSYTSNGTLVHADMAVTAFIICGPGQWVLRRDWNNCRLRQAICIASTTNIRTNGVQAYCTTKSTVLDSTLCIIDG